MAMVAFAMVSNRYTLPRCLWRSLAERTGAAGTLQHPQDE